jgi:hypothetical protein
MEVISNTTAPIPRKLVPVSIEIRKPANLLALMFIAAHIPIALFLNTNEQISAIHAYATLGVGVVACIIGRLDIVAATAAYIAGAEVLWRMTGAPVYWEYGKYASILIFFLGIVRSGIRNSGLPFLYFAFLIPSAILTVEGLSVQGAQQELSFNLSGPLALLASACFFSGLSFNKRQMGRIFIALLAPITGIAAIAIYSTLSASSIYFGDESNTITSGGYGPNQVSAMLGLGALTTMLCFIAMRSTKFLKIALVGLGAILLGQCLLTFSRGGVYLAAASILVAAAILVKQPRKLFPLLGGATLIGAVLFFWIVPWLNSFTGGTLVARYKDTRGTGRVEILKDDIRIWSEHPILGTGPGRARQYRRLFHRGAAAHIEYTRMLAEHGLFGLASIAMLILLAIRNLRQAGPGVRRAVTASMLLWSFLFMVVNAMRLAAPSFLIGLSSAHVSEDDDFIETEIETDEEEDA